MSDSRRYVRGDINIILNGMIASGTIASYKTSFDLPADQGGAVHVTIYPGNKVDPPVALRLVRTALDGFKDEIVLTVEVSATQ